MQDQALATLRGQIIEIISGTVFVFLGFAACGIAAMRRQSGVRVFVWLGIWSAMYGALRLMDPLAAVARLPNWFRVSASYLDTVIMAGSNHVNWSSNRCESDVLCGFHQTFTIRNSVADFLTLDAESLPRQVTT